VRASADIRAIHYCHGCHHPVFDAAKSLAPAALPPLRANAGVQRKQDFKAWRPHTTASERPARSGRPRFSRQGLCLSKINAADQAGLLLGVSATVFFFAVLRGSVSNFPKAFNFRVT